MVLVFVLMITSMLAVTRQGPFAQTEVPNVSEAVLARDLATVVRRLEDGESATTPRTLRAGLLGPAAIVLTPAEAAIVVDDANGLEVLVSHGLPLDLDTAQHLVCLSVGRGSGGTLRYLAQRVPKVDPRVCGR
jgi:hypothetical protein